MLIFAGFGLYITIGIVISVIMRWLEWPFENEDDDWIGIVFIWPMLFVIGAILLIGNSLLKIISFGSNYLSKLENRGKQIGGDNREI